MAKLDSVFNIQWGHYFEDERKLFRMWLMGDEITFFYFVWENDKTSLKDKA